MTKAELRQEILENIKPNARREITGEKLQKVLLDSVDVLGTESDPIFMSSPAASITDDDIPSWDSKASGAEVAELRDDVEANSEDIADLQNAYAALTQSDIEVVDSLPASGQANTIYRVTGVASYSDYMWNGSEWVLLATYNNAIDLFPTEGSDNLVTSGGVYDAVQYGVEALARVTPITEGGEIVEPKNWLNFSDPDFLTGQRIRNGVISNASSYNTSGFIPVKQNETYTYAYGSDLSTARAVKYINFYDEDKEFITGSYSEDVTTFTPPTGAVYVRMTAVNTNFKAGTTAMLYYGAAPSEYSAYFEPYLSGYSLKEGIVGIGNIAPSAFDAEPTEDSDNLVTSGAVKAYVDSHSGGDLTERVEALEDEMADIYVGGALVEPKNWIDFSDADFLIGYYINANGTSHTGAFNTTGYVPIQQGKEYHYGYTPDFSADKFMRFVNFYDSDKNHLGSAYTLQNVTSFTPPTGAAYARISADENHLLDENAMLYFGATPTEWSAYFAPYYATAHLADDIVVTDSIQDGAVTVDKLATDAKEVATQAFRAAGALAEDERLTTAKMFVSTDYLITAQVIGVVSSVRVGILGSTYGRSVRITPTSLEVINASGTIANTYAHGLTLGSRTTLMIQKGWDATAILRLFDDDGNYFEQTTTWRVISGQPFADNEGTASVNVTLTFTPAGLRRKTWIFGDSYLSFLDSARWIYYPIQWGWKNYLLDARGGENATEGLADFNALLSTGAKPKFVVWCMGMNAAPDEDGQPNATWLAATNAVATICERIGATLVISTIPTVPARIHTAMNTWVRGSGFRYIDFAAAVEEVGTNYWKNWGQADAMLSSDETHPTAYGAKALLSAVLADFPELILTD